MLEPICGAAAACLAATSLLDAFGSAAAALSASPERMQRVLSTAPEAVPFLRAIHALHIGMLRQELFDQSNVLSNSTVIEHYLFAEIGQMEIEQFRVIFLTSRFRVIKDVIIAIGTINQVPVFPREIVRRALDLDAAALILAHNHPSGSTEPSVADLDMTSKIAAACRLVDIQLLDHYVLARTGWTSMRSRGLM